MNKYLEQEKRDETRRIVTIVADKMVVPLYFLYWLFDILYVPHLKWEFLGIRCLIIPAVLLTHWWLKHADSYKETQQAALFLTFICAGILHLMIYLTGKGSLYILTMHLVAIGGLSFVSWSRGYFVTASLLVYAPYYAMAISRLQDAADWDRLLVNSFFIIGVFSISLVIHLYRESIRERELLMRLSLENEVEQRKKTEQELIVARDEALAATRAKESFLANMSHEIRTPLTAIIGFAEHSLDPALPEAERQASLKTVVNSGDHLLNIINDILDFSKLEANSLEIEKIAMDPLQLAIEVKALVSPLADKKGLPVQLDYEFPLPMAISSDSMRIKQILINLCSNAIKFTDNGAITITLAFDRERNKMIYSVKDCGIGMSAEQIERIFDPFKQADSSITRRYGGTGLGLHLSSKLAQLLGGELTVSSQVNVGSEFKLSLAAGDVQENELIHSQEQLNSHPVSEVAPPVVGKLKGRVLLAEDNENNQRLITLYLRKMGLQVSTAMDGAQAVRLARAGNYDLVLMDMQMPVLSGVDAVRQLRERGYSQTIIALTANASQEDRRQCLEAGCQDFLTKPITSERLYHTLAMYLQTDIQDGDTSPLYSNLSDEEPELVDLINRFISALPEMLTTIETSYQEQTWQQLKEEIHNLKGVGGGYGFPQLSEYAAEIEQCLHRNEYRRIAPLINELQKLSKRLVA